MIKDLQPEVGRCREAAELCERAMPRFPCQRMGKVGEGMLEECERTYSAPNAGQGRLAALGAPDMALLARAAKPGRLPDDVDLKFAAAEVAPITIPVTRAGRRQRFYFLERPTAANRGVAAPEPPPGPFRLR